MYKKKATYIVVYARKILFRIIVVMSVVLLAITCNSVVSVVVKLNKMLPIYAVNTDEKVVALTLDCAWENSDTTVLMELFNKYEIKATFFVTGDFCTRYPNDIKLWAANGHSIQNHSNNHPHVESIDSQKLIDDTTACDDKITELIGKTPTLYRAPYGEYSDSMLGVFEQQLTHKVIQWDVDSRDWQKRTADAMIKTVLDKVKNGSIILFHNDTINTPQALQTIIPTLKSQGYRFALVEDMIYKDGYTLDHEGRQICK